MNYLFKQEKADEILNKFRNAYFVEMLGLSTPYISQVLHRKRNIAKHLAYAFTKAIDYNLEIDDLFEQVK